MLLQIENLALAVDGTPILRNVHLSLAEGEIYALIGPNGAGKSTTIAAALGLLTPDAGEVRLFGVDPRRAEKGAEKRAYRRLGVLPEHNGYYDWMPAEGYLDYFARLYGRAMLGDEIERRLSAVGLEPRPGQAIGTYSRGMRQRLGLARALLADPELLILDEPTNGLDPRGRRDIHDVLLDRASRGVGILMCTHLLDDVDRLCKRVGIIVDGRTLVEGNIAELVRNAKRAPRFRLRLAGEPPASGVDAAHATIVAREGEWWTVDVAPQTAPDAVWRELLFRGWPIVEIRRDGGGLEALYLALTEQPRAA